MAHLDCAELDRSVANEISFLQNIYRVGEPDIGLYATLLEYSPLHPEVRRSGFHRIFVNLGGDWRDNFLPSGLAQIFVSAFKVLDMTVEWLIRGDGRPVPLQFQEKSKKLRQLIGETGDLPQLIADRSWLQERLIGLYDQLYPMRNTVVHGERFSVNLLGLEVAPKLRKDEYGDPRLIRRQELDALVTNLVILVNCLTGKWRITPYLEMSLRWSADQIATLHQCPLLGQLRPERQRVRVYQTEASFLSFNVGEFYRELDKPVIVRDPSTGITHELRMAEPVVDLEIILISPGGAEPQAYLIPSTHLGLYSNGISLEDLTQFAAAIPPIDDLDEISAALRRANGA